MYKSFLVNKDIVYCHFKDMKNIFIFFFPTESTAVSIYGHFINLGIELHESTDTPVKHLGEEEKQRFPFWFTKRNNVQNNQSVTMK